MRLVGSAIGASRTHAGEDAGEGARLADDERRRSPARRARADHDQAALPELVEQEAVGDRDRVVGVVLEAIVALVPREDRAPTSPASR
jgi:hypothetical protein